MTFPEYFRLVAALRKIPPRKDEGLLSVAVANAMDSLKMRYTQEVKIGPKERIDFFVSGSSGDPVGLELKTSGNTMEITRQIYRYADFMDCIILLTSKPINLRSGIILNGSSAPCWLEVIELWNNPL